MINLLLVRTLVILIFLTYAFSNIQAQPTEYSYKNIACIGHRFMEANGFHGKEGDRYDPYFQAFFLMDFIDEEGKLDGTWAELWKRRSDYIANPEYQGITEWSEHYVVVYKADYLGIPETDFCVQIPITGVPLPYMGSFGCLLYFGDDVFDSSKWNLKLRDFNHAEDCPVS